MKAKRTKARKSTAIAPVDRRLVIADAALRVLAAEGARGLTHRAVDAEAALPQGSTSYYFRSRGALVKAAASRLCELDERDVLDAESVPALLARWRSPSHRGRLIARFELFMDATRNAETRALVRRQRRGFVAIARAALARSGAKRPDAESERLVALVDGLLLSHLLDPRRLGQS
jgi:DNA-binding transcriptional regulator YbjK